MSATLLNGLTVAQSRMQVQAAVPTGPGTSEHEAAKVRSLYASTRGALRAMVAREGVMGLFRGYSTAVFLIPGFWGVYFTVYESAKRAAAGGQLPSAAATSGDEGSFPGRGILASAGAAVCAGVVGDIVTYPLWTVRVRLQTQHLHQQLGHGRPPYKGTLDALRQVVAQEGVLSLYRGLGASLLGASHVAVQFPLYEGLKAAFGVADSGHPLGILCASSISKVVASLLTYPLETVRNVMQDDRGLGGGRHRFSSALEAGRWLWGRTGLPGLYAGVTASIMRAIPSTVITFIVYEAVCAQAWEEGAW